MKIKYNQQCVSKTKIEIEQYLNNFLDGKSQVSLEVINKLLDAKMLAKCSIKNNKLLIVFHYFDSKLSTKEDIGRNVNRSVNYEIVDVTKEFHQGFYMFSFIPDEKDPSFIWCLDNSWIDIHGQSICIYKDEDISSVEIELEYLGSVTGFSTLDI